MNLHGSEGAGGDAVAEALGNGFVLQLLDLVMAEAGLFPDAGFDVPGDGAVEQLLLVLSALLRIELGKSVVVEVGHCLVSSGAPSPRHVHIVHDTYTDVKRMRRRNAAAHKKSPRSPEG